MEELKKLRLRRGQLKGTLTRIETFVQDPISFTSATVDTLEARKDKLISALKEYESVQLDILSRDESDKEEMGIFEEAFFNTLAKLNESIRMLKGSEAAHTNNVATSKLPNVDIPTFDGKDFTKFKPFYDMFLAVIDNNKSLSNVQKLFYLRKYLSDEALSVIVNLPLVNGSYQEALELLKKRYNNKARLISSHINVLLDIPCMSKGTAASIRSFVSQVQQQLHALKNLNEPTDKWDMILITILGRKLDSYTNRAFNLERDPLVLPTMTEFINYLEKRAMALEDSLPLKGTDYASTSNTNKFKSIPRVTNVATPSMTACRYCDKIGHAIYNCSKFQEASIEDRQEFAAQHKLCTICIKVHAGKPCKYRFKCKICKKCHNTLLHTEDQTAADVEQPIVASTALSHDNAAYKVLLPTVKVKIFDKFGREVHVRALLDSGSSASFVTSGLVERLCFQPVAQNQNIIGITNKSTKINKSITLPIESCQYQDVKFYVDCHVVDTITTHLPQQYFDYSKLNIPKDVRLSDDTFNVPSEISLLLGADIYFGSLLDKCIKIPNGPVLQSTLFGFVVAGKINQGCNISTSHMSTALVSNFAISDNNKLEHVMNEFWLNERVPEIKSTASVENVEAEKIFQDSVKLIDGQFHVDMPLKCPVNELQLGNSFSVALQRFYSLERKLVKNVELLEQYKKFIDQYVEMGHAKEVDINSYDVFNGVAYFLAHHAVFNVSSKTTKLRVVFDGGMKSKNGTSVNDVMLNGPVVQGELFDILILFRTYLFTLICDIEKMFRCILINSDQKCLQNILWRDDPSKPIRCLQLQTVTYGLKASTFLATRCLVELVNLYGDRYPLASQAILSSTYVDDVITGTDDVEQLQILKSELIELLKLGNFKLHKWCSNCPAVLDDVPNNLKYFEEIDLNSSNTIKTLGLKYDITLDTFTFQCPLNNEDSINTKRKVLSFIGKMFDPLGLISPIIVSAKIFMQELWFMQLGWDTVLPEKQLQVWKRFLANLKLMSKISVPRLSYSSECQSVELVGYADASFKAYGCCIYLRLLKLDGSVETKLLCSKSRVAPLSKSLTIPQLELNSALLLAQLVSRVSKTLSARFSHTTFLYSDSQIVLCWIKSEKPKVYNTYVNNRVKDILILTKQDQWSYVKSSVNPADLVSRGIEPQKLQCLDSWWHGPKYLEDRVYKHENNFRCDKVLLTELQELHSNDTCAEVPCNLNQVDQPMLNFLQKFSSLNKLQNVVGYIYRFFNNVSRKNVKINSPVLTPKELNDALLVITKCYQRQHFSKEIETLLSGKNIKSGISNLHPYVCQEGILRVGGRLQNADIPHDRKHPPILPKNCFLTTLLIEREHLRLLHGGARLVLSSLAQRFWIINGIREVKKVVHKCVKCARMKAAAAKQLMGSLPPERITTSRPFQHVGIDFCGPFSTKVARIRRPLTMKSYVALFVCFATKAIHVELVSNLTTEAFLACLDRFISRRGMPTTIHCDNAKTFKGAANTLKELYNLQSSEKHRDSVYSFCNKRYISFKFIPSYSPHHGGIWEAGCKGLKHHLKRVIGNLCLTFEELYTVIVQIEGVLNSRPLLTLDPNEGKYLTPGHFLIGAALTSYPDVNLTETPVHRLKFWNIVTKLKQDYWKSWSKDYLNQLQSRPKWKQASPNLKVGDLVLVKDLNTAPLVWPMARIVKIFPGKDNKVRVAEVRMGNKTYVRSVTKFCPLPLD